MCVCLFECVEEGMTHLLVRETQNIWTFSQAVTHIHTYTPQPLAPDVVRRLSLSPSNPLSPSLSLSVCLFSPSSP